MNENQSLTNKKPWGNEQTNSSNPSFHHHSTYYLGRNPANYIPPYNPVYYPGSYNHMSYAPVQEYNHSARNHYKNTTMVFPPHHNQDWYSPNLPSPLTASSSKAGTNAKFHGDDSGNNGSGKLKQPSPPKGPQPPSPKDYICPEILKAVHALKLPPSGNKYSVEHWKGALKICYRWKTTTNEDERQFYRTSTTTNSLSSSNLKSIKYFCEQVLQRKTKRRQFAIHWKESGLKKIVDEGLGSDKPVMDYNDPKLERVIDDYFSGRTRSNGYNQAREKVLEDRQKEILYLWDKLMSIPSSNDSSHQKLYLLQLAIERPYSNKTVEIEMMHEKIIHDVAIEGFGGKSYWEKKSAPTISHCDEKSDVSVDPELTPFEQVLPINKTMNKRFWKCVDTYCGPEHQEKKRRVETTDDKIKTENSHHHDSPSKESLKIEASAVSDENKENENTKVVPI